MSKYAIICKIIEKKYVDQPILDATPQIDSENFTIHDNFCLVNIMFTDETIEISNESGSLATRAKLDTSQVGSHAPFYFGVMFLPNSLGLDGNPNMEGTDFLEKVHFYYQYYENHSVTINPGSHNLFPSSKLRSIRSKIKADYDLMLTNFTKSGNHSSSFTATAISIFNCNGVNRMMRKVKTCMMIQKQWESGHLLISPTRSLSVMYLRNWVKGKPEHTNFCSKQILPAAQLDSQFSAVVGNMQATSVQLSMKQAKNPQLVRQRVRT